eukprot:TRINITY_DN3487_c0_g3_i1.p1 TRINITY_DN3487_c0_g3~~TRINITY_DN3487_c0_g3_i1.p1  ORF type:complete len:605 (-),score=151.01 TRINITY_DN3487_c0_g3_i1:360-2174(-)
MTFLCTWKANTIDKISKTNHPIADRDIRARTTKALKKEHEASSPKPEKEKRTKDAKKPKDSKRKEAKPLDTPTTPKEGKEGEEGEGVTPQKVKFSPNYFECKAGMEFAEDGKTIVSAPCDVLLNYLILASSPSFKRIFIHSYTVIMDSQSLLKQLHKRLQFSLSTSNITSKQLQNDIAEFVIFWIKSDPQDWTNRKLNESISNFLKDLSSVNKLLAKDIESLLRESPEMFPDLDSIVEGMPLPLLASKTPSEVTFMDVHPLELARQLTVHDYDAWQAIDTSELIGCPWTKQDAPIRAPNVLEMIKNFNSISFWVATEIVSTPNKKQRVLVLKRVMLIMSHLLTLHNYHTLMAMYCGLMMFEVQRLSATWKAIGSKDVKFMDEIERLLNSKSNWANLRHTISEIVQKNKSLPLQKQISVLPFHGIYLKAFIGIEENPSFLESTDNTQMNVNFSKMELISTQIEEITLLQKPLLKLYEVHAIQKHIKKWISSVASEDELLKLSKLCESSSDFMAGDPHLHSKKKEKEKEKEKHTPRTAAFTNLEGKEKKKSASQKTLIRSHEKEKESEEKKRRETEGGKGRHTLKGRASLRAKMQPRTSVDAQGGK